jgi:hypothetical protein
VIVDARPVADHAAESRTGADFAVVRAGGARREGSDGEQGDQPGRSLGLLAGLCEAPGPGDPKLDPPEAQPLATGDGLGGRPVHNLVEPAGLGEFDGDRGREPIVPALSLSHPRLPESVRVKIKRFSDVLGEEAGDAVNHSLRLPSI